MTNASDTNRHNEESIGWCLGVSMAIFQCASGLVLPSSFHLLLCSDCAWLQEEREFGNKGVQEERGEQGVGGVEGWEGEESKVSVATSSKWLIYNVQPNANIQTEWCPR